jgi:hypothetical protein
MPWGGEGGVDLAVRTEFQGKHEYDLIIELEAINPGAKKEAEEALGKILPTDAVKQLLKEEAKLVGWFKKSPANPALFALDPLAGLEAAGIKLGKQAREALLRHRERVTRMVKATSSNIPAGLTVRLSEEKSPAKSPKKPK